MKSKDAKSEKWNHVSQFYSVKKCLGKGSFGEVRKAQCLKTKRDVAIKYVKLSGSHYHLRQVIREITILRKLTEGNDNIFTTKILDVILPPGVEKQSENDEQEYDLKNFTHVFLVMDLGEASLHELLRKSDKF